MLLIQSYTIEKLQHLLVSNVFTSRPSQNQNQGGFVRQSNEAEEQGQKQNKNEHDVFCKRMAFRQKLIHKDAIRTQKKYDKRRKEEFEKRQQTSKIDKELNVGDRVLRYVGDKYVGNQRKLQQQYDDKIWKVIKIKCDGNLIRIEDEDGKIKNIHRTKIRKIEDRNKNDRDNDNNDEDIPESYWVYIDSIDGNV